MNNVISKIILKWYMYINLNLLYPKSTLKIFFFIIFLYLDLVVYIKKKQQKILIKNFYFFFLKKLFHFY